MHSVKRKLDEIATDRSSSSSSLNHSNLTDTKLDNLDMEMSDEDENNHHGSSEKFYKPDMSASLQLASTNLAAAVEKHNALKYQQRAAESASSSFVPSSTASLTSHQPSAIRNYLDPRQNRQSNRANARSSGERRKYNDDDSDNDIKLNSSSSKDESSLTPVRDEHSPSLNTAKTADTPNGNNPLDFLTKFINKSSSIQSIQIPSVGITNNNGNVSQLASSSSSSTNLSYLVNSLKKFVNTNTSTHNHIEVS